MDPDPAAAVEVQDAARAVSLARCVSCREIGKMQIVTAVRRQDIGIAGLCHDAAALYVAALQPESGDIPDHKLVSIVGIHPMPVFARAQVTVTSGLSQVVFPVFQLDYAVRSNRFQQFIHSADMENGFRSRAVFRGRFRFPVGPGVGDNSSPEAADGKKQRQEQRKQGSVPSVCSSLHHSSRPFRDRWFLSTVFRF